MLNRLLRYFRIAISLLFLLVIGFLFVDFTASVPRMLAEGVTWIQFVPSLLTFVTMLGLTGAGFLLVLLLTLLFGRVYCSTVCPLGIFKDVIAFVSRQYTTRVRGRLSMYKPTRPHNLIRYPILAIAAIVFVSGSVFLLNLLDPFSLFGKIASGLFRPVYYSANNLLADLAHSFGVYRFYHVETRLQSWLPLLLPLGMLGLIVWMAWKRGRLYCNTVCPVGTLLGLLSRHAMFRIQIETDLCNHCAQCSISCKAQCIDLKSNEIDFSRCVGCFNCLQVCSRQGIGYQNTWFGSSKPTQDKPSSTTQNKSQTPSGSFWIDGAPSPSTRKPLPVNPKEGAEGTNEAITSDSADKTNPSGSTLPSPETGASGSTLPSPKIRSSGSDSPSDSAVQRGHSQTGRRGFLAYLASWATGTSVLAGWHANARAQEQDRRDALDVVVTRPSTIPEVKEFAVSPPGSLGLDHFTSRCTACQLCVSVCPTKVLQPSFLEYGFTGMMQPRLDFHASFCNFDCVDCADICPTGAILPLSTEQKHVTQIGVVKLELDNCVVQTEKTACGACAEHCPTQAVRMVPYENGLTIPEIVVEQCVGCGACEYICPTRPYRAIYVDGSARHAQAVPPVIEALDYTPPEEDFPF